MKAKLTSGEIIDLKKECDCKTHDGPHWLYMNNLHRKRLKIELDRVKEQIEEKKKSGVNCSWMFAILVSIAEEQITRLKEKQYYMKKYNIEELL